MTGGLTANGAVLVEHHLQHVTVADVRPQQSHAATFQSLLQTQIGHHRAHHGAVQRAGLAPLLRNHEQQLVAVDDGAVAVHHDHPVAVAVEGDA